MPNPDISAASYYQQALESKAPEPVQLSLEAFAASRDAGNQIGNRLALDCKHVFGPQAGIVAGLQSAPNEIQAPEGQRALLA